MNHPVKPQDITAHITVKSDQTRSMLYAKNFKNTPAEKQYIKIIRAVSALKHMNTPQNSPPLSPKIVEQTSEAENDK